MLVILVTIAAVALCVGIHYETFVLLSARLPRWHVRPRRRILFGILAALVAHMIEIGVFALAYAILDHRPGLGDLAGADFSGQFPDYLYFSSVTYTTLGFGDVTPSGPLRLLVGIEALTGLVLITWSASFTFLHTQRLWNREELTPTSKSP